jgi:hypothetical protein
MKNIIQFSLIILFVLSVLLFQKKFFSNNKESKEKIFLDNNLNSEKNSNNLIENLKYEINLDKYNQYTISSEVSEIIIYEDSEMIKMKKVIAILRDKKNTPITIKSDFANYWSELYNTNFYQNVSVKYMDNNIYSDNLNLDFENKKIRIFDNVLYEGNEGIIKTENIIIDMITKKIDINMNDRSKNVKIYKY